MAENVIQFRLDARSAEGQIRALAMNTANVKVTFHAAEQMENRGFSDNDLFNVLRTGFVEGTPMLSDKNEWKITKGNIVESSKNLELKEDLFT